MHDPASAPLAPPPTIGSVVPVLVLGDPEAAASFYALAFGAEVRQAGEDGAELLFGATLLRLLRADRRAGLLGAASFGGAPVLLAIGVGDLEAAVARATAHGAVLLRAPSGAAGGSRNVLLRDPFLYAWELEQDGG